MKIGIVFENPDNQFISETVIGDLVFGIICFVIYAFISKLTFLQIIVSIVLLIVASVVFFVFSLILSFIYYAFVGTKTLQANVDSIPTDILSGFARENAGLSQSPLFW